MKIYIEDLNFNSILTLLVKVFLNKKFKKLEKKIFYIDSEKNILTYLITVLFKIIKIKIQRLEFTMMEIRDKNNEISRLRINQLDLFQFEKKILKNKYYQHLINNSGAKVRDRLKKMFKSYRFGTHIDFLEQNKLN